MLMMIHSQSRHGTSAMEWCINSSLLGCFLPLRPPVLKPRLHLLLGETEALSKKVPVCHRQVLVSSKLPLQKNQLLACEHGPGLTSLALTCKRCRGLQRPDPRSASWPHVRRQHDGIWAR